MNGKWNEFLIPIPMPAYQTHPLNIIIVQKDGQKRLIT